MSWVPTIPGLLAHPAPDAPVVPMSSGEAVFRLLCLANALAYYIGGTIWLSARIENSRGKVSAGRRLSTMGVFVFLINLGPIAITFAMAILEGGHRSGSYSSADGIRLDREDPLRA